VVLCPDVQMLQAGRCLFLIERFGPCTDRERKKSRMYQRSGHHGILAYETEVRIAPFQSPRRFRFEFLRSFLDSEYEILNLCNRQRDSQRPLRTRLARREALQLSAGHSERPFRDLHQSPSISPHSSRRPRGGPNRETPTEEHYAAAQPIRRYSPITCKTSVRRCGCRRCSNR